MLVVDDGSSDNSEAVVKKYQSQLNIHYFFQEDKGLRSARARNVGIQHAQSDICIFIDSGVLLGSQCLEAHINSHQRHACPLAVIGYVYGFLEQDESELITKIDHAHLDNSIAYFRENKAHLDIREQFYTKIDDKLDDLPAPWIVFWTANVSVDRPSLLAAGLFDEKFNTWGAEDLELGYRLRQHNVRFTLNRDAVSIHYPHENDFEKKKESDKLNKRYIHEKHNTPITELFIRTSLWQLNEKILLLEEQQKGSQG